MSLTRQPRSGAIPLAAQPAPPSRLYSFTGWQASNPTAPPPGDRMDADYDNTNITLTQTLAWAATSLNTDGSLKAGTVGQSQLVSGLFDDIAQDIIAEVQPLVDQAQGFASAAGASSLTAQAAATAADHSNTAVAGTASTATAAANTATTAQSAAQGYATTASTAAANAQTAANHTAGDVALASDYADVTQAWAEHMPDTIPPNILAVMGITGDHWSSRWWANQAVNIARNSGAFSGEAPPPNPYPGQFWFDSANPQLYVWYVDPTSAQWVIATAYAGGLTSDAPSDGQTYGRQNGAWQNIAAGGPYLPLTGGTVTGPLNYTATGSTTPRSAQDRAADVANVLDYGADPTGVADSAPAIKAAAAKVGVNGRNKAVYLPTGTYRVNSQITLTQGQCLYGDSRGSTIIRIDQAFSPTDTAVLYLTSTAVDPGPMVRDLAIQFIQPTTVTSRASFLTLAGGGTSGAGGTGVMYPPAIAGGTTSVRSQVSHVRISGAWDGITTNGLNHVFWLDDIEMGALNCGVSLGEGASGVLDFAHINGYHFWNFDFSGGLITVFNDGQTIGMRLGNQNGLDARGVCLWVGRLVFTSQASAGWFDFTNLLMDGTQATVEIAAGAWIQISNFYSTAGSTALRSQFSVAGGTVIVTNWYSTCSSPFPDIAVSGGYVTIIGGALLWGGGTDVSAVTVSAGVLRMNNMRVVQNATTLNTVPLIAQTGTGGLQVDNMDLIGAVGSGGISISIAADSQYNIIGSVSLPLAGGWSISVPNTRNDTVPYGNAGQYGAVFPAPLDASSIQTGAYSFRAFAATKHYSTAYGHLALSQAQDGAVNNTAFGSLAGQAITTGINNTLLGRTAGFVATTGSNNILVGYNPDNQVLTTGSNNLLIGNTLGIASASTSNTINVANILKTTGIDVPATAVTTISGSLLASVSGSVIAQAPLLATTAPLHVQATGAVNSLEGKVWLHGSFPTGADFTAYVAAAIRSGWSATAWTGGYADIWVTNAPNNPANDANMGRVARFTSSAIIFDQPLTITASGPTIRAGTGAATGTQPKGSLWMRTDGAVGSTLYVSQGAGTWNAVAAV